MTHDHREIHRKKLKHQEGLIFSDPDPYGGQLSAGRMHGYWVAHEACLRLRGQVADRQVEQHEVAAVSAGGGPIAGCLLLSP